MLSERQYRTVLCAIGAVAALQATACQTLQTKEEKGAVIGAAGGAIVGGAIGKATGSTARGAIVGAAVGGAAGAIIGHQMDQKAKEIAATVPGATVTRVGEGLVVTFESGLMFDFDSDVLRMDARKNLDNLASSLSNFGDSKLLLVGHTDAVGSADYNEQLSLRRASSVRACSSRPTGRLPPRSGGPRVRRTGPRG